MARRNGNEPPRLTRGRRPRTRWRAPWPTSIASSRAISVSSRAKNRGSNIVRHSSVPRTSLVSVPIVSTLRGAPPVTRFPMLAP